MNMRLGGINDFLGIPTAPSADSSSWTDDLPICSSTGVGYSPNQTYKRDGYKNSDHELEDQSFHFRIDENISLYGVFDGHCGSQASKFAVQRIPAEILLGQLTEHSQESEIREVLRQAFLSVEREYLSDIIGQKLAERTALLSELQDGVSVSSSSYELIRRQLEACNREVASGTTAVVVLIFYKKLYVANVGHSKALLYRTDSDGIIRIVQLSIDHDLKNEEELMRLQKLNLNIATLKEHGRLGNQENTRCLGNYLVKGGFKVFETLYEACTEPVIPDPDISAPLILDDSCRFLVLISNGLFKALEEATENDQVKVQLAQIIVGEFSTQTSLTGIAQAVVDKISRMHHDCYMSSSTSQVHYGRDDMTLLVRNFNFPLASPSNERLPSTSSGSNNYTPNNTSSNKTSDKEVTYTGSTESSVVVTLHNKLPLDEDGKIAPYVDFSDYFKAIETDSSINEELFFPNN